jgi:hypothetical protein
MKRPNKIDWIVYRVFRWWWNPILRNNPNLLSGLTIEMQRWQWEMMDREMKWLVYPCYWKVDTNYKREDELPVAAFEYREHAEEFCNKLWPGIGEVHEAATERERMADDELERTVGRIVHDVRLGSIGKSGL